MLKGRKKHIDKEQGKTKHEAPRSVNYRATQNENNIRTTALERSVVYTTVAFKGLSLHKLHPRSRYNSQYKKYIMSSVRIMASLFNRHISVKTQNQIDHCVKTKKEYSWLIPHCKPELKETTVTHKSTVARTVMCRQAGRGRFPV